MNSEIIDIPVIKEQAAVRVFATKSGHVAIESMCYENGTTCRILVDPLHIETLVESVRFAGIEAEEKDFDDPPHAMREIPTGGKA